MTKPLSDGSVAVALLNRGDTPSDIGTTTTAAGRTSRYTMRDLWAHTSATTTGTITGTAIAPHGLTLLRVIPHRG